MSRKKILVIEDSKLIAEMLTRNLNEHGFEAVAVHTGEEGLLRLRKDPVDGIILDLVLPGKSGESVCREVRSDEALAGMRIIMLTSKASEVDRIVGKVIGADAYIPKPFSFDQLLAEINRLF